MFDYVLDGRLKTCSASSVWKMCVCVHALCVCVCVCSS